MTHIERTIDIAAPPERVFEELTDLHRLDRWSTITASHEGPEERLRVGHEFRQNLRGRNEPADHLAVHRVRSAAPRGLRGGLPGGGSLTMRQVVVPTSGGSSVQLVVDYELPGSFLGELLDRVYVERRNEREAQHSLENLKDLLEGRPLG